MNMKRDYTPDNVVSLERDEIFVFGSNLGGIHGAGAAKTAALLFGAKWGRGEGLFGQSYALPTVDVEIQPLEVSEIGWYVERFFETARSMPHLTFLVTEVGCGLGGKKPEQIAPLFENHPENVILPKRFINILNRRKI